MAFFPDALLAVDENVIAYFVFLGEFQMRTFQESADSGKAVVPGSFRYPEETEQVGKVRVTGIIIALFASCVDADGGCSTTGIEVVADVIIMSAADDRADQSAIYDIVVDRIARMSVIPVDGICPGDMVDEIIPYHIPS